MVAVGIVSVEGASAKVDNGVGLYDEAVCALAAEDVNPIICSIDIGVSAVDIDVILLSFLKKRKPIPQTPIKQTNATLIKITALLANLLEFDVDLELGNCLKS